MRIHPHRSITNIQQLSRFHSLLFSFAQTTPRQHVLPSIHTLKFISKKYEHKNNAINYFILQYTYNNFKLTIPVNTMAVKITWLLFGYYYTENIYIHGHTIKILS